MMKVTTKRRIVAIATTAVFALVLSACGSGSSDAADHNKEDVNFATGMIPHHAQAVEMSKLAATRASSPEVKDLAAKIQSAQQPEIDTMNGWLKGWGEKTVDPGASMNSMDHSMHGGSGMAGMMSTDEMQALTTTNGRDFDRLFLQGMIKHHEGAISMSKTEQEKGKFEPAKNLAGSIISSQQAEIDQMKQLVG